MSIGENLKFLDHSLTERKENISSSYLLKKKKNLIPELMARAKVEVSLWIEVGALRLGCLRRE